MLGFKMDGWDYATFVVILLLAIIALSALVWLMGLPGRIAISRNHPDAEAVKIMGYSGFLAVVPWINAFIWAFKPTDIIDIRHFPKEEAEHIKANIERLSGPPKTKHHKKHKPEKTQSIEAQELPADDEKADS